MHTAKRAIRRLALIGWLGLFGWTALSLQLAQAAAPPERVLPDSTIFVLKLNDVKNFREAFRGSHYGQLWNDPAMKDFKDDLVQKLEDATKAVKEKLGVSAHGAPRAAARLGGHRRPVARRSQAARSPSRSWPTPARTRRRWPTS